MESSEDRESSELERMWDPTSNTMGMWFAALNGDVAWLRKGKRLRRLLPGHARCKNCEAPFDSLGGVIMRLVGRGQYARNPRFCSY